MAAANEDRALSEKLWTLIKRCGLGEEDLRIEYTRGSDGFAITFHYLGEMAEIVKNQEITGPRMVSFLRMLEAMFPNHDVKNRYAPLPDEDDPFRIKNYRLLFESPSEALEILNTALLRVPAGAEVSSR